MQYGESLSSTSVIYSVAQVAGVLKLSRAKVYQLIRQEGLPVVRFGRVMRVRSSALHDWLKQREEAC